MPCSGIGYIYICVCVLDWFCIQVYMGEFIVLLLLWLETSKSSVSIFTMCFPGIIMRPTSRFSAIEWASVLERDGCTYTIKPTSSKLLCMSQYNVLFLVNADKGTNECSAVGNFDTRLEVQV